MRRAVLRQRSRDDHVARIVEVELLGARRIRSEERTAPEVRGGQRFGTRSLCLGDDALADVGVEETARRSGGEERVDARRERQAEECGIEELAALELIGLHPDAG